MALKQRAVKNTTAFGDGIHIVLAPTQIASVGVDNYSGNWLQIRQSGDFVPPYTIGFVAAPYSTATGLDVVLSRPGLQLPISAALTALQAEVVVSAYDEPIPQSLGYSIAPVWYAQLTRSARYLCSTFRTLGDATAQQRLFKIRNPGTGGTDVSIMAIRRLRISTDRTAVSVAVAPVIRFTSMAQGAGVTGTQLFPSNTTSGIGPVSSATTGSITLEGATASDGGAATAITGAISAAKIRQAFISRQVTAVGWKDTGVIDLIREEDAPFIIPPLAQVPTSSAYGVTVDAAAAADNPVTNQYLIECEWEEYKIA